MKIICRYQSDFLKEILEENKDKNIIKIGVASWYPLWRVAEIFSENDRKKILILSNKNNFGADYIYSNNISEVDRMSLTQNSDISFFEHFFACIRTFKNKIITKHIRK